MELNSTELLPSNKLTEVGAMVMGLETQAERNQLTLDSLQNQVCGPNPLTVDHVMSHDVM